MRINVDDLLDFIEYMEGRGLVVTSDEAALRLGIEEWLASPHHDDRLFYGENE